MQLRPIPVVLTLLLTLAALPAYAAKTVLVLGDSLSAGYGIDPDRGWVHLLARTLADTDYRVVNASISGETTRGGLDRLPALLARHHPAVVIIELGANDGLRGYPLTTIRANLEQLVTLSQNDGSRVLLVGVYIPPNYGHRYTQRFHALFGEVATDRETALVPFLLDGIATQPALMQGDGLHPKAAAQPRILQNVLSHLKPLLGH